MPSENETENALRSLEGVGFNPPQPEGPPVSVKAGRLCHSEGLQMVSHLAQMFARSSLVPEQFRGAKGSAGHANCFLALSMALELDIPWMSAITQLYVVRGRVGIPGQMLIALANRRAPIKGSIRYREKGEGDDLSVTAFVVDRNTNEEASYRLTLSEAKAAGASGPGWDSQPKLRLRYRAATYLVRTHYPEVMMGLYDVDEIKDLEKDEVSVAEVKEKLQIAD